MNAPRALGAALILVAACSSNGGGGTRNNTPPPVINSFAADSSTVGPGQSTTLRWSVTNATSVSIAPGVGAVTGTSAIVQPTDTTTYILTATNAGGTTTSSITVTVRAPPPVISSFKGSPSSIAVGGSSTLSWAVSTASSLSIDQGVGDVTGLTSVPVSPAVDTTYRLTANGPGGVTTRSTTVTVHAPSLHVQYDDPAPGGKVRLVRNAASTATHLVLDLQVGSTALNAFGIALTLPMDAAKVTFVPTTGLVLNSSVLDAGGSPATAAAVVPSAGPLQNMLVIGVARKKQAVTDGDVTLAAGATVFSIVVNMNGSPATGLIFSGSNLGTAARAALLTKAGTEVAGKADFAIGDLSIAL